MKYTSHFNTKQTAQSEPVPGKAQVQNNAGGYTFQVSDLDRLVRFLILGSEGGTYYATEQKLTVENAQNIVNLIKTDGLTVVQTIVDISTSGRAPKNDPAIFALALAATFGDAETKNSAYLAIRKVCRIGTHIYQFCENVQALRGWSRGLRSGVAAYYLTKQDDKLALDLVKYRQRNGWTHRDVLRLSHPKPESALQGEFFKYATGKQMDEFPHPTISAFEVAQTLTTSDVKDAQDLIENFELPWEALPTELLNVPAVWEALIPHMPMTALVRNLGKITSIGVLSSNLSVMTKTVVGKLTNVEAIKKSRIHPLNVLQALVTYQAGHGLKGKLTWEPVQSVVDALNEMFYLAFQNVESTGLNYLLAVDCSGSMGAQMSNSFLDCRTAAAAMALVTAGTEKNTELVGFTSGSGGRFGSSSGIASLKLSAKTRLNDLVSEMARFNWGGTDCALPIIYAQQKNLFVDVFVVYTDNETWAGQIHPFQALQEYRKKVNPNAKMIVCGMTSSGFTIADPSDKGMLDVVGFDSATPSIISEFSKGNI